MVRILFLVVLQTVYCKPETPVKRELLEISRKATFRNIPCTRYVFSTELQTAEVSLTLLKCDSTTDALPAILKFLRTNEGNTCGGISFRLSYRRVVGQLEFFKRSAIKDAFLIIFQNLRNSSFSNVLSKISQEIFLEAFS